MSASTTDVDESSGDEETESDPLNLSAIFTKDPLASDYCLKNEEETLEESDVSDEENTPVDENCSMPSETTASDDYTSAEEGQESQPHVNLEESMGEKRDDRLSGKSEESLTTMDESMALMLSVYGNSDESEDETSFIDAEEKEHKEEVSNVKSTNDVQISQSELGQPQDSLSTMQEHPPDPLGDQQQVSEGFTQPLCGIQGPHESPRQPFRVPQKPYEGPPISFEGQGQLQRIVTQPSGAYQYPQSSHFFAGPHRSHLGTSQLFGGPPPHRDPSQPIFGPQSHEGPSQSIGGPQSHEDPSQPIGGPPRGPQTFGDQLQLFGSPQQMHGVPQHAVYTQPYPQHPGYPQSYGYQPPYPTYPYYSYQPTGYPSMPQGYQQPYRHPEQHGSLHPQPPYQYQQQYPAQPTSQTLSGHPPIPSTASEGTPQSMERKHERGKTMTTAEVVQWLEEIGLGEYKELFEDEGVNGSLLAELDMDDLEEMGVSKKYHRKKLITKFKEL